MVKEWLLLKIENISYEDENTDNSCSIIFTGDILLHDDELKAEYDQNKLLIH